MKTNIKSLRKEFNISQPQLSKETGLSKGGLSFWENEERIPNAKVVIILSRYFQVSCDYILCITNDSSTVYRQDDYNIDMSVF